MRDGGVLELKSLNFGLQSVPTNVTFGSVPSSDARLSTAEPVFYRDIRSEGEAVD